MKVKIIALCPKLQLHDGNSHVKQALENLGFKGKEVQEDELFGKVTYWELSSQEVDLGDSKDVIIAELAEKLQVFQSVPVTSNSDAVFFTIEDWWM